MGFSIAMLSTYPPAQCGIATFAHALGSNLLEQGGDVSIVRVAQSHDQDWLLHEPSLIAGNVDSTMRVAQFLNLHDLVIVQHEYGIYGGLDGAEIIDLLKLIRRPILTVLHTVLTHPSPHQHSVMRQITQQSSALVTMTQTAKDRLIDGWNIDPSDVTVIPHGARDNRRSGNKGKRDDERPVFLTWGLLGEGKGIEWAIRALGGMNEVSPVPRYRIVGETHPRVKERRGEIYRERLVALTQAMNVEHMVEFEDRYLTLAELQDEVSQADVVVLPYDSKEQVTSGVLIEAIAAGKPVISTEFPHAVEVLSDGSGLVVPQGDALALRAAMHRVLTDPELANQMADIAHRQADAVLWPNVARRYLTLARNVASTVDLRDRKMALTRHHEVRQTVSAADRQRPRRSEARMELGATALIDAPPTINYPSTEQVHPFQHLFRMSTPLGIFEHCLGNDVRIEHGYCLDDTARALTLTVRTPNDAAVNVLTSTYFALVLNAISDDGRMHNRRGVDGKWSDIPTVGDHWGRAIRALGSVVVATGDDQLRYDAVQAIQRALHARSPWLRSIAGAIVGCADVLSVDPSNESAQQYLIETRPVLAHSRADSVWPWPENRLTYGNAQIPEAMMALGHATHDEELLDDGLRLLTWLVSEQSEPQWLSMVPASGRARGDVHPAFDQQPIEVATLAEAAARALQITGEHHWADVLAQCAAWFLGANDSGLPLFNLRTGGGHDGLEPHSVNDNQGAESTIAALTTFQLADRLSVWSRA